MTTVLSCNLCGFGIEYLGTGYDDFVQRDGEACHEDKCDGELRVLHL